MDYLRGAFGLLFIIGIAVLLSSSRKSIDWKLVVMGVVIQIIFGIIISRVDFAQEIFKYISQKFVTFLGFAQKGGEFLWGDLSRNSVGNPDVKHNLGFLFVFQAFANGYLLLGCNSGVVLPWRSSKSGLLFCVGNVAHHENFRCGKPLCCCQYFRRANGGAIVDKTIYPNHDTV